MEKTTDAKLLAEYEEIAEIIEAEGLDYAVTEGYLGAHSTSNPELAGAFEDARKSLNTIERIMRPYSY